MSGTIYLNKREMARRLEVSIPTLDGYILRYPDLPIASRGAVGIPWAFEPEPVVAFVAARRAEEAADLARRTALAGEGQAPATPSAPSARDRLDAVRAAEAEDDYATKRGTLVLRDDVNRTLRTALAEMGAFLGALPSTLARRHALPAPVLGDMKALIAIQTRAFVRALDRLAPPGAADLLNDPATTIPALLEAADAMERDLAALRDRAASLAADAV